MYLTRQIRARNCISPSPSSAIFVFFTHHSTVLPNIRSYPFGGWLESRIFLPSAYGGAWQEGKYDNTWLCIIWLTLNGEYPVRYSISSKFNKADIQVTILGTSASLFWNWVRAAKDWREKWWLTDWVALYRAGQRISIPTNFRSWMSYWMGYTLPQYLLYMESSTGFPNRYDNTTY